MRGDTWTFIVHTVVHISVSALDNFYDNKGAKKFFVPLFF
jgi:hypothetical protein